MSTEKPSKPTTISKTLPQTYIKPSGMCIPHIMDSFCIDILIFRCSMFNAFFICIINLAEYFKNGIGENCPASQIIDTEYECKNSAADVLGLSFGGGVTSIFCPAGCHWEDMRAFFNRIIDPSQTNQHILQDRREAGGVCVGTGKNKNIISE